VRHGLMQRILLYGFFFELCFNIMSQYRP